MYGLSTKIITVNMLSAGVTGGTAGDILFFVNILLGFCALIELTAFAVLLKKTSCAFIAGIVTVVMLGLSLIMFVVQLIVCSNGNGGAQSCVYACTAIIACALVSSIVYCILLSRNSHSALSIAAGVCQIVPPVGAGLVVLLSYRIQKDTRVKKLVYNGYAFTYAALEAFCDKANANGFIDASESEVFETLSDKEIKKKLSALKKLAKSNEAEKLYDYAAALLNYDSFNSKKAVKLLAKSAELGHTPSLFNLGYYYETGAFVKRDYKRAREYYKKAADGGDSDADLRLGILAIKEGNVQEGMGIFKARADIDNDLTAKYNLGICYERGLGVEQDIFKALELYTECGNAGLFAAQERLFAIAGKDINSPQNGEFFRKVTDRVLEGTFGIMIHGLIQIKRRMAADASDYFLSAVKQHDEWEGAARCLVGTLYIDCGKLDSDKQNGIDYIKSAFDKFPEAKEVYAAAKHSIKIKRGKKQ